MSFLVPYPVGNRAGVDHTFWPAISRAEFVAKFVAVGFTTNQAKRITDRLCPVPVTLDQLMAMAWRVREWTVDASTFDYTGLGRVQTPGADFWTLHADIPEISVTMKRVKSPPDIPPLRDVTDEQDILGPATDADLGLGGIDPWKTLRNAGVLGQTEPGEVSASSDATPPYAFSGGSAGAGMLGNYVIYDPDPGMFYPPISVSGFFSVLTDTGTGQTTGVQAQYYALPVTPTAPPDPAPPGGIAGDVQQGTLTISGIGADIVIPLGMFGEGAGSAPPIGFPDGGSGSIDIAMAPVAWWPYKNSVGLPVYDAATGAQLVDPFS